MTGVCVSLHPQSIEDLTAIVSLYRPGPMDSIPKFIASKHNPQSVKYTDPALEPILSVTYGVMVYQEQVIDISAPWAATVFPRQIISAGQSPRRSRR